MGSVTHVNFKKKEVIKSYTKFDWQCSTCSKKYSWDSRSKDNTIRLEPIVMIDKKAARIMLCEYCVDHFHEVLVKGRSDEGSND